MWTIGQYHFKAHVSTRRDCIRMTLSDLSSAETYMLPFRWLLVRYFLIPHCQNDIHYNPAVLCLIGVHLNDILRVVVRT